jgi:hypothetical protein
LADGAGFVKVRLMAKPDPEALAKALRENLLKRKAQGRAMPAAPAPREDEKKS